MAVHLITCRAIIHEFVLTDFLKIRKQKKQETLQKQETRIIKGVVSEESGPLPGAGVFIKGSEKGTNTNFDGFYEIEVSPGDVLVFSYIGYETVEIIVHDQKIINAVLPYDGDLCDLIIMGSLRVKEHDQAPIRSIQQPINTSKDRAEEIAMQKEHWNKVKAYKKYKQEQQKAARLRKKKK